jgi:DNA invertase Pin-like site-specific DNA recombinase
MATILYARVSTTEQTIEHQRTQAERAGFRLDKVISEAEFAANARFREVLAIKRERSRAKRAKKQKCS